MIAALGGVCDLNDDDLQPEFAVCTGYAISFYCHLVQGGGAAAGLRETRMF